MFKLARKTTKNLLLVIGTVCTVPVLVPWYLHPNTHPTVFQNIAVAVGAILLMWAVEFDSSPARKFANFMFWFGLPLIVGVVAWSILQYHRLETISDPVIKGYAGVAITAVTGLALFAMRYWYRMSYGLTEAGVGLYLGWIKWTTATGPFGDLSKDTAFMTGLLTASIYLVVRGLDNVQTGWKARAKRIEDSKGKPAAVAASDPVDIGATKA